MQLGSLILTAFLGQLLAAAGGAQVQQQQMAETTEGTGININCSHPNIQGNMNLQWYRQLPDQAPHHIVTGFTGDKPVQVPPGRLWVSAERRSSALWLARPRRGDAAVYYCALGDTGRGAGAAAGQEPARAGPGVCVGAGGTAPDGTARGRCRSARRGRLAPNGPNRLLAPRRLPCPTGPDSGNPALLAGRTQKSPATLLPPPGQESRTERSRCLAGPGHAQKDSVLQFPAEMTIQVGHKATLHCNFSTSDSNPYAFWYQQHQTQSPQMLLWENQQCSTGRNPYVPEFMLVSLSNNWAAECFNTPQTQFSPKSKE
ncbi:uncharacterized protein LOC134524726 [Chroicocephalus ridibundus]|uniref:uncharacterized protein LOC134524726 n=1 Tax=Chroicocephalus ridibundus TaxID=1192867 RepID=UPI002FDE15A2